MANINHSTLTDPKLHEPKGISTATLGQVYVANGSGSGTWQLPTGALDNQVIVKTLADLPTPVANVITLAADTAYFLDGDINIGVNRIALSVNTAIIGITPQTSSLISTTAGALFTSSANFTLKDFSVSVSSGTVFSLTGGATEQAILEKFFVTSALGLGTISGWYLFYWHRSVITSFTNKLTLSGACGTFIVDVNNFVTGYTTAIDLTTATFNIVTINRCGFLYASATSHVVIAANSANINTGWQGRIFDCHFDPGATNMVLNSDDADIRWQYRGNTNLAPTTKNAQGHMHTTTTTTIGVGDGDTGNPKLVNAGTNWVADHQDQFTVSTGGRFTYVGVNTGEFLINCNISGTTASGTQTVNHYIAKNGTVVTASKTQKEYTSTAVGSPAPATAIVDLSTGDYVELFVENITGTNNWDSYILNMTIGVA